ncbi:MAG: hypothetical protein ACTSO9_11385 [Candidatus Helarchaeota archaeon]
MKVKLLVNNKKIPLKPFVIEIFYNIINSLVDTLKIPDEKITKIEISIEKND